MVSLFWMSPHKRARTRLLSSYSKSAPIGNSVDLFLRPTEIGGHDSKWFLDHANSFKAKGQTHTAWLYYLEGRDSLWRCLSWKPKP